MKFKINKQQLIQENVGKYIRNGALIGGGLAALGSAAYGIDAADDLASSREDNLTIDKNTANYLLIDSTKSLNDAVDNRLKGDEILNELDKHKGQLKWIRKDDPSVEVSEEEGKQQISNNISALDNTITKHASDINKYENDLTKYDSPEYLKPDRENLVKQYASFAAPIGLAAGAGAGYLANRYKKR